VLAEVLEGMAWLAAAEGHAARAARLGGAAKALEEALGAALHPVLRPSHDQAVQTMQAALGEAAFAATWAEGRSLPLDEVITLALEDSSEGSPRA
jgi:non-specific serine/threonine protein kinase